MLEITFLFTSVCLCCIRLHCWIQLYCLPQLSLWYTSSVLETTLLFTSVVFVVYVINVWNNVTVYLCCLCNIRRQCWKQLYCLPQLSLWYTLSVLETTLLFTSVVFMVYVINVWNNVTVYFSCLCDIRRQSWKQLYCLPQLSFWYTSSVFETTLLFTSVVFVVYGINFENNLNDYLSCLCGILHQCWKQLYFLPKLSLWYTSSVLETTLLFTSVVFVVYVINVKNNFTVYLSCLCGIRHQC
jgi:hypothetical protein